MVISRQSLLQQSLLALKRFWSNSCGKCSRPYNASKEEKQPLAIHNILRTKLMTLVPQEAEQRAGKEVSCPYQGNPSCFTKQLVEHSGRLRLQFFDKINSNLHNTQNNLPRAGAPEGSQQKKCQQLCLD